MLFLIFSASSLVISAIVYGMNATGKSNLVRAITYFRDLVTIVTQDKDVGLLYLPFAFDHAYRDLASSMSMTFYIDRVKYYMAMEFIGNKVINEVLSVYFTNRPTCLYHRTIDHNGNMDITFNPKAGLTKVSCGNVISNTSMNCTVLAALDVDQLMFDFDIIDEEERYW